MFGLTYQNNLFYIFNFIRIYLHELPPPFSYSFWFFAEQKPIRIISGFAYKKYVIFYKASIDFVYQNRLLGRTLRPLFCTIAIAQILFKKQNDIFYFLKINLSVVKNVKKC